MSERTKEPWRVMGPCAQWETARIFSGARYIGSIGNSDETESETRANADRIVSCVNACAGMEDPELEIGEIQTQLQEALAAIENQKDFISALKAQRDELLAKENTACFRECQLVEALKAYINKYGPGYSSTDTLAYDNAAGVLAAIANAEKDKP